MYREATEVGGFEGADVAMADGTEQKKSRRNGRLSRGEIVSSSNLHFDGGEISFPEYSLRTFKAGPGAAIVFSASILHQVSQVTRGRRYVFLTFLFDEEAERVRQANLQVAQKAQRQPQLRVSV